MFLLPAVIHTPPSRQNGLLWFILAPSNTLKLSPGVEAARRYLQTVLSGFGLLLEQTVEYALEQYRAENYF